MISFNASQMEEPISGYMIYHPALISKYMSRYNIGIFYRKSQYLSYCLGNIDSVNVYVKHYDKGHRENPLVGDRGWPWL